MSTETLVTKASGEQAAFSVDKLKHSLERSGVRTDEIEAIVDEIQRQLHHGISTQKIHQIVFAMLKKRSRIYSGKYKIKRAIMELGPSGFPFEKYVAEILRSRGYTVKVNQLVVGHCVTHEVDALAYRDNTRCLIECKFHNGPGVSCDVKIPLYIHSRFRDISRAWQEEDIKPALHNEGWVITNTKFTADAIQYGNCAGLKLLGWNYPSPDNLQTWIEEAGLYPVTCITTLTQAEKQYLLASGIVLCKDVSLKQYILEQMGLSKKRIERIIEESQGLSADQYRISK